MEEGIGSIEAHSKDCETSNDFGLTGFERLDTVLLVGVDLFVLLLMEQCTSQGSIKLGLDDPQFIQDDLIFIEAEVDLVGSARDIS